MIEAAKANVDSIIVVGVCLVKAWCIPYEFMNRCHPRNKKSIHFVIPVVSNGT